MEVVTGLTCSKIVGSSDSDSRLRVGFDCIEVH